MKEQENDEKIQQKSALFVARCLCISLGYIRNVADVELITKQVSLIARLHAKQLSPLKVYLRNYHRKIVYCVSFNKNLTKATSQQQQQQQQHNKKYYQIVTNLMYFSGALHCHVFDEMARDRLRQFANRNCYKLSRVS